MPALKGLKPISVMDLVALYYFWGGIFFVFRNHPRCSFDNDLEQLIASFSSYCRKLLRILQIQSHSKCPKTVARKLSKWIFYEIFNFGWINAINNVFF